MTCCFFFGFVRRSSSRLLPPREVTNAIFSAVVRPCFVGINVVCGDYLLELEKLKKLVLEGIVIFDVVTINPPFSSQGINYEGRKRDNITYLWNKIIEATLPLIKKDTGYLCAVHPPGWRAPGSKLWKPLTSKQIHYLEIHNADDGQKTFKCATRYDWYILQNTDTKCNTDIVDEKGFHHSIDLSTKSFLPNFFISEMYNFLSGENTCEILYDRCSYRAGDSGKSWVSKEKTDEFKFPIVCTIGKNGPIFWYSNTNKLGQQFGVPKVIIGAGYKAINDFNGEYGVSQHMFCIKINSNEEGDGIVKALSSLKFRNLFSSVVRTGFDVNTDVNILKHFRQDFWKEFVV